ncbi:hypothetical protein P7K49_022717 [Saguinus oedipus]|uniref:Uncharacterized protein n=1 Tax=Saguinus oedipus TaxID=9490 RepID=A0ABQ9UK80_SAGOE|nr:hypothetical protein P7K49_022717 [Saguinus oedipus]
MKLENCIQANKTIQNLKFNSEARLVRKPWAATTRHPTAPSAPPPSPQPAPWQTPTSVSERLALGSVSLKTMASGLLGDKPPVYHPLPRVRLLGDAGIPVPQRTQEMAALRETVLRLWSEEGPRALLGSQKALPSVARQQVFIKDEAPGEVAPVNCWGVYQAVRACGAERGGEAPGSRLPKPGGAQSLGSHDSSCLDEPGLAAGFALHGTPAPLGCQSPPGWKGLGWGLHRGTQASPRQNLP